MSSRPFVSAIAENVLDISGQLNIKCPPGADDNPGIKFYDAAGTKYIGLRPISEDLEDTYDLVLPKRKGSTGEAMTWDISGNLEWTPGIGDKGEKGDVGNKGDQGPDGNTALNLWHENWTMPSENTNNIVTVTNDNIYFQAFWVDTTGDYTNIKFRCFDNQISGLGGIGNSKILTGIYENGYTGSGAGETPWNPQIGGPGMPWPNNRIAEGSKAAFINVHDGFWVDISLNIPITLTRNEIYFLAFKAGEDDIAPTTWQTTWYGIDNVNDASGMSMLWIRDTQLGNMDWETLPTLSYGSETVGTTIYYPPTRTDKGLWFTVYGPQTAIGASKGITGQKGATGADGTDGQKGDTGSDGNDGVKGEKGIDGNDGTKGIDGATNINYQTWDLVNTAFYNTNGDAIDLSGAGQKNVVYYHAFFPPITGVYNKVEVRVWDANISTAGLDIFCGIYSDAGNILTNTQAPGSRISSGLDKFGNIGTFPYIGGIDSCDINDGDGITLTKGTLYWIAIKYQDINPPSLDTISFYASKTGDYKYAYKYDYATSGLPMGSGPGGNYGPTPDATFWFRITGPSSSGSAGSKGQKGESGTDGIDGTKGQKGIDGIGTKGEKGIDGIAGTDGTKGQKGIDGIGTKGQKGIDGIAGTDGTKGQKGIDGIAGTDGTKGQKGIDGIAGTDGTKGQKGIDGIGTKGEKGIDGIGTKGQKGIDGIAGTDGAKGQKGIDGIGTKGEKGIDGIAGTDGAKGQKGIDGIAGTDGTKGQKGIDGIGTKGEKGIDGIAGTDGTKGQKGIDGIGTKGQKGIDGIAGTDGTKGQKGLGDKGEKGIDGVGTKGDKGITGSAGTGLTNRGTWVTGTTYNEGDYVFYNTSLSDNTTAMWILHGSTPYLSTLAPYDDPAHWIIFEAPSGAKGDKGIDGVGTKGQKGIDGIAGTDGTKGQKGIDGVGTKGQKGIDGIAGTDGTKGQKGIDGVGTKGQKGIDGIAGTDGTKGQKGIDGIAGTDGTKGQKGIDGIGTKGEKGIDGTAGTDGTKGQKGIDGTAGTDGTKGQKGLGDKGEKGIDGIAGTDGAKGQKGIDGTAGTDGAKGQKGLGDKGEKGIDGTAGTDGTKGQKGIDGIGTKGEKGINGTTGTKGDKGFGDKGEKGIDGIAGTDGTKGQKGVAGVAGSASSALQVALSSNAQALTQTFADVLFSLTPDFNNNTNVFSISNTGVASYVTIASDITACITINATINNNGNSNFNAILKIQKYNGLQWIDCPNSVMNVAGPSSTPNYYHSSMTIMVDIAGGERIKVLTKQTGSGGLQIINSSNGDTTLIIYDVKAGQIGAKGQKGIDGIGTKGEKGIDGTAGTDGTKGQKGLGDKGEKGIDGTAGTDGAKGQKRNRRNRWHKRTKRTW